ncbi:MAG: Tim44/TimA family putative adaptor protein [Asticcacaulis sp.]
MVVLVILAIVAVVILFQLYNVLGRKAGFRIEEKALPGKPEDFDATAKLLERPGEPARLPNLEVLKTRDVNFNEINFLEKARETYEQVVLAFHRGELDPIKDRLSEPVFRVFSGAVSARAEAPQASLSFVDQPKADLDTIEFKEDSAQVRVRILSELAYESTAPEAIQETVPETAPETKAEAPVATPSGKKDTAKPVKTYKRTAEFWTFQKGLRNQNSPWVLARVEAAKA